MKLGRVILSCVFFLLVRSACGQSLRAQELIGIILDEMVEDGILTGDYEEQAAELLALSENRLDLNQITREQVRDLFFLTEKQQEILVSHREIYGPYRSESEIMTLPYFTKLDAKRLMYFATVNPSDDMPTYHRGARMEIVTRVQRTYPDAKGFKTLADTVKPAFCGSPYKGLLRVNGEIGDGIKGGLVAEKDAGEPVFSHGIGTTDFLSGHISFLSKKFVRRIILGHFHAKFGQGLGLWTGFSPDISTVNSSIYRSGNGVSGTLSASESGYLRGIAIEMGNQRIKLDLLASHTDGDMSMIELGDSAGINEYAVTLRTDGYHRTESELRLRNNFQQMLVGGYFKYSWYRWNLAWGANHWHGSKVLGNKGEKYKMFFPKSDDIGIVHLDYSYRHPSLSLYGEVAYQSTRSWGIMHGADIDMGSGCSLTIGVRGFGNRYYSLYQNPFSRSAQPGGERGLYIGVKMSPIARTSILANVNIYRHCWLKYLVPAPSGGYKARVVLAYNIDESNRLNFRFRHDEKAEGDRTDRTKMAKTKRSSGRIVWSTDVEEKMSMKMTVETVKYRQGKLTSCGVWLGAQLLLMTKWHDARLDLMAAHFDTDDYYSRIYVNQPDVLYAMSIPSYQGKGVLALAKGKISLIRSLEVCLYGSYVKYYDQEVISSGNSEIDSSQKIDAKVQVRIKLRTPSKRKRIMA